MKLLALILLALHYPPQFGWKSTRNNPNFTVQSLYELSASQELFLVKQYKKARTIFFRDYENINLLNCGFDRFTIKIVPRKILNNRRYFKDHISTTEVFGRFFWRGNLIYLTPEVFERPEYLAHELAHYFYADCGVWVKRLEEESRAYQFQELFVE